MRTYDEAYEAAQDRTAFSNGTEGDAWMSQWCHRCVHDRDDPGCPLVLVAMMGRTPSEWFEQPWGDRGPSLYDRYHCAEFRSHDDPGPNEPEPIPDPSGQETLLPRERYEGVRLLSQPREAMVP